MDENTKWRVAIYQEYQAEKPGSLPASLGSRITVKCSTQIADLRVKAKNAQEASDKGKAYIEAEEIEHAYVSQVSCVGLPVTDCTEV